MKKLKSLSMTLIKKRGDGRSKELTTQKEGRRQPTKEGVAMK
jgi:hypothetical protein